MAIVNTGSYFSMTHRLIWVKLPRPSRKSQAGLHGAKGIILARGNFHATTNRTYLSQTADE